MKRREFLHWGATGLMAGACVGWARATPMTSLPPLRIVFFTDIHAREDLNVPSRLTVAARALAETKADAFLCGGDIVHGGFTSRPEVMAPRFHLARRFLEEMGHPVFLLPGNHDFVGVRPADGGPPEADPLRLFRDTFGTELPPRSWELQGYRFLQLQTVHPVAQEGLYEGRVSEESLAWLEAELARTPPEQPLILVTHLPLQTTYQQVQVSPLAPLQPNLVVTNAHEVLRRFAHHHLRLILQGHLHVQERIHWNDRVFFMGGAVCGGWWQGAHLGTPPGYSVITLMGQEVRVEYKEFPAAATEAMSTV